MSVTVALLPPRNLKTTSVKEALIYRSKDKRKPFCSCQDFGFLQLQKPNCVQFPTQSGNVLIKPSALSRWVSPTFVSSEPRQPTHP